MKRVLTISYWCASIFLVAIELVSVGYSISEAFFMGCLFLPGALCIKYFFPMVEKENRGSWEHGADLPVIPDLMINPVFISIMIAVLAIGDFAFEKWLDRKFTSKWEDVLGSRFIRIHRSYLVNKSRIDNISSESVSINNYELPISRKYRSLPYQKLLPLHVISKQQDS